MTLAQELQSLDVESPIDLMTVTAKGEQGEQVLRFCNNASVIFQGIEYLARPCTVDWVGKSGEGTEPGSKIYISDVDGAVGALIDNFEDAVVGAIVNVKRTLSMFLDGEPTADPTQFSEFELRINQPTGQFGVGWEFSLIPSASLERLKLPGRTYLRRCGHRFRDANCNARTDLNFDANGNSTTLELAVCNNDLDNCELYQNILKYGGFPGVVRNNG